MTSLGMRRSGALTRRNYYNPWLTPAQVDPEAPVGTAYTQTHGGTITPTSVLGLVRAKLAAAGGQVAPSSTLRRAIGRTHRSTITPTSTLRRATGRTYRGIVTPAGALTLNFTPGGGGEPPGAIPAFSEVGSSGSLTFVSTYPTVTTITPGVYTNMEYGELNLNGLGTYEFHNCDIGKFPGMYPGVTLIADHTTFHSGIWGEPDGGGVGSLAGSELTFCLVDGGNRQALRPNGTGDMLIEDSWFLLYDAEEDPGAEVHTETLQILGVGTVTANRCAFSCEPTVSGASITATLSVGQGASTFTDCVAGYYNGSTWSAGGGVYLIYPGENSVWVRPFLYHNGSGYWYTGDTIPTGSRLVDPTLA